MFVRLVGFLLLGLFDRRATLSEGPTASLVEKIESSSREGGTVHDVVFEVGKWHWDHLLRTCAFDFLLHRSVLQTGHSPWGPQHPPYSFRVLLSRGKEMAKDCMMVDGRDYEAARGKVHILHATPSFHSSYLIRPLRVMAFGAC